ncbi:hypothetical protein LCGC14_2243010, partial [marine sediment metagenome]
GELFNQRLVTANSKHKAVIVSIILALLEVPFLVRMKRIIQRKQS